MNSRLDTLQAAILIEKLKSFPSEFDARQRIARIYNAALKELGVDIPEIASWNVSAYAQYTIRIKNRDACQAYLKSKGVPTSVHYPYPLHKQPALSANANGVFPVSDDAAHSVLSLPMHPYISEQEQQHVISSLIEFIGSSNE